MDKLIDIKLHSLRVCKNSLQEALILPCNLRIRFTSDVYVIPTLSVCVKNGKFKRQFTVSLGEEIDITDAIAQAGSVEISAIMVLNGEPVKEWRVEPIIVKEVNHEFEAIPEFVEMRSEISKVKAAIKELSEIISEKETL